MSARRPQFADRRSAGRNLAEVVASLALADPIVLALPRGGVPVGYEVATRLGAPLDILLARKIGAPGHEEFAIGALVDGADPQIVLDADTAKLVGATPEYIEREIDRQSKEIERRRGVYNVQVPISPRGRNVILVDDGIATGATVKAALKSLRLSDAGQIVLAVPVAPASAIQELRNDCDELVCLQSPEPFYSVGAHYQDFEQTSDTEVVELLTRANREQ